MEFEQYEPLAGFVGYEDTTIKAIGFYRYKCASRPEDVTGTPDETEDDEDETEGTGEGEGEGTGETDETDDNGNTETDNGGEIQNEEDDIPLDEDQARETDDTLNELNA